MVFVDCKNRSNIFYGDIFLFSIYFFGYNATKNVFLIF